MIFCGIIGVKEKRLAIPFLFQYIEIANPDHWRISSGLHGLPEPGAEGEKKLWVSASKTDARGLHFLYGASVAKASQTIELFCGSGGILVEV